MAVTAQLYPDFVNAGITGQLFGVEQDMVAVDWSGGLYALDSHQAVLTPLGTGLMGQNATALDEAGTLWSTHVSGSASTK